MIQTRDVSLAFTLSNCNNNLIDLSLRHILIQIYRTGKKVDPKTGDEELTSCP
jgi:hypothetical protein